MIDDEFYARPENQVPQGEARRRKWAQIASDEQNAFREPYCDYCEQEGHTFSECPRRDDDVWA